MSLESSILRLQAWSSSFRLEACGLKCPARSVRIEARGLKLEAWSSRFIAWGVKPQAWSFRLQAVDLELEASSSTPDSTPCDSQILRLSKEERKTMNEERRNKRAETSTHSVPSLWSKRKRNLKLLHFTMTLNTSTQSGCLLWSKRKQKIKYYTLRLS